MGRGESGGEGCGGCAEVLGRGSGAAPGVVGDLPIQPTVGCQRGLRSGGGGGLRQPWDGGLRELVGRCVGSPGWGVQPGGVGGLCWRLEGCATGLWRSGSSGVAGDEGVLSPGEG